MMTHQNSSTSARKIATVTGGSRGLGRSTVLSLAKRGVDSIFTYNSKRAESEKVTALVAAMGRKAIVLQLDTGNVRTFDAFVQRVRQAWADLGAERFDFLVNNAAALAARPRQDGRKSPLPPKSPHTLVRRSCGTVNRRPRATRPFPASSGDRPLVFPGRQRS